MLLVWKSVQCQCSPMWWFWPVQSKSTSKMSSWWRLFTLYLAKISQWKRCFFFTIIVFIVLTKSEGFFLLFFQIGGKEKFREIVKIEFIFFLTRLTNNIPNLKLYFLHHFNDIFSRCFSWMFLHVFPIGQKIQSC